MANGKTNKESHVNKPTGSALDRSPGITKHQAQQRRTSGVEIRPAGKGSGNKQY